MSAYLTTEIVNKAINLHHSSIELTLDEVTKRHAGHMRVSAFRDGEWQLVATRDFSSRETWEYPYDEHATGKEAISKRTGKASRTVQEMYPELLQPGDTIYYGNAMSETIIVSFSGVEAYFDEMFCKWVLATCLALIQHELEEQKAKEGASQYE